MTAKKPKLETETRRWVTISNVRVEHRDGGKVAITQQQPIPRYQVLAAQQSVMTTGGLPTGPPTRSVTVVVDRKGLREALDLLENS